MSDLVPKIIVPKSMVAKEDRSPAKPERDLPAKALPFAPEDRRQRGLMVGSLCLLLLALSIVLWRDREFWFPETPEAQSVQPAEGSSSAETAAVKPSTAMAKRTKAAKAKHRVASEQAATENIAPQANHPSSNGLSSNELSSNDASSADASSGDPVPPGATITARTVLPPLEVEVVAGDSHRTIRPGSSSVRVDLQPASPPQSGTDTDTPVADAPVTAPAATADNETAANITSDAAERVRMSAATSDAVALPVRPNYPLLARQMKVQGSVILQALIGKDGVIQNLRVVSGPRILASAAQDAVRQWHFKPHYQGSEAVETQAKITVNFTISTN